MNLHSVILFPSLIHLSLLWACVVWWWWWWWWWYVYVHMCGGAHVNTGAGVHVYVMCMWRPEGNFRGHSSGAILFFLKTTSLAWNSPSRQDWLIGRSQEYPYLCIFSDGTICMHHHTKFLFCFVWAISGRPTSGPHACKTRVLPMKPYIQFSWKSAVPTWTGTWWMKETFSKETSIIPWLTETVGRYRRASLPPSRLPHAWMSVSLHIIWLHLF